MAVLTAIQNGNFTNASTWGLVDSTSYLDSRVNSTTLTTTTTNASANFTTGAITISGIAIQIKGVGSVNMTMRLYNATTSSIVKDVTISLSDLPNTGNINSEYVGWVYFKFDSDVTLSAGEAYNIRMFINTGSNQCTVYTNGTTNNWSRALITSTNQAPASGDTLIIPSLHTNIGVYSATTVTMNNTITDLFGNVYLGGYGKLSYAVSGSTNYKLRLNGDMYVAKGSTLTIGNTSTPFPITSTALLEFNCSSDYQYQLFHYGTIETKCDTNIIHRALLNSDAAVSATTLTTDISTGWKNGDVIGIASTTKTTTQYEKVTLTADASGTTLNCNTLTYFHDGDSSEYIQADIVNLSKRIKIGTTTSFRTRINLQHINTPTSNFKNAEFANCLIITTNVSLLSYILTFENCSFWQTGTAVTQLNAYTNLLNTINSCVFFNFGSINSLSSLSTNSVYIGSNSSTGVSVILGNDNSISSAVNLCIAGWFGTTGLFAGTLTESNNNKLYSALYGYQVSTTYTNIELNNWLIFNCAVGVRLTSFGVTNGDRTGKHMMSNIKLHSNTNNFDPTGVLQGNFIVKGGYIWGGKSPYTTSIGLIAFNNSQINYDTLNIADVTFGKRPDGVNSHFSLACLRSLSVGNVILSNCLFYGTESIYLGSSFQPTANRPKFITSIKHNGISGNYKEIQGNGELRTDTSILYNSKNTLRLTPASTIYKTFSNTVNIPVKSGQTGNISVKVRKSVLADGTAYNGGEPRLILERNPLIGIYEDTVVNTTTAAANGNWETLSFTTSATTENVILSFYVDCIGNLGWVNVADWKTTNYNDTRNLNYNGGLGIYTNLQYRKGGGNYSFFN
ncbi:hypothetical protein [Flavobacterium capsici]|uniref:Uncharacterized protein n=1 Tax=Flavobacterium capsici TaxID=3075618 RepID=A0AA96J229_9FLAO|nr:MULTISPECIES: hypothetical protein [unclassified Flavobacterium]WNM18615.1 hypothetical protein RN608_11415 [Flavobacterium sp. PMR2A8]WNM22666.1 hypothetical protein RN605_04715 [Flavobacterium sp. PMTSA4]